MNCVSIVANKFTRKFFRCKSFRFKDCTRIKLEAFTFWDSINAKELLERSCGRFLVGFTDTALSSFKRFKNIHNHICVAAT